MKGFLVFSATVDTTIRRVGLGRSNRNTVAVANADKLPYHQMLKRSVIAFALCLKMQTGSSKIQSGVSKSGL